MYLVKHVSEHAYVKQLLNELFLVLLLEVEEVVVLDRCQEYCPQEQLYVAMENFILKEVSGLSNRRLCQVNFITILTLFEQLEVPRCSFVQPRHSFVLDTIDIQVSHDPDFFVAQEPVSNVLRLYLVWKLSIQAPQQCREHC